MQPAAALKKIDGKDRIVRAELNLEQWSIWQPAQSNNKIREKIFRKEIQLSNGDTITAELRLIPTVRGMLTTEDQKTYYGLIKIFEDNSREDGYVYFSLRKLARILGKKWGSRTIETLTDSLWRIHYTQFNWLKSYYEAQKKERLTESEGFQILEKLKIIQVDRDGRTTRAEGYFKFNDDILLNLKENYSKPVLIDVVTKFKSEIAQIIYTQLDRILSKDIQVYERKTKELFDDLGLEGKSYQHLANRKQILSKAISELENTPLSNGYHIASIKLEKTKDGADYKIVAKRGLRTPQQSPQTSVTAKVESTPQLKVNRGVESHREPPSTYQTTKRIQTKAEQEGDQLLAYFNLVFFGVETPTTPTYSSHRDLATSIVAQHGEKVARHFVDFSKIEANKTNYNPATFGGIQQYLNRAIDDYTQQQKLEKRRIETEREEAKKRDEERAFEERQEKGNQLYTALPEADREALTKKHEQILLTIDRWKNADFSQSWQQGIFDMAVREAIREELLNEQN